MSAPVFAMDAHPAPPPAAPCSLSLVENAFVTPFNRGRAGSVARSRVTWVTGAVHRDNGHLVRSSQRPWSTFNLSGRLPVDPAHVLRQSGARRLSGTWLYGGHWAHHFGHFLLETLPNLWPDPTARTFAGLLFHRSPAGQVPPAGAGGGTSAPTLTSWQKALLRLAGYRNPKIRIIRSLPVDVDAVAIPERPVLLKAWARPEAATVWDRVGQAVDTGAVGGRVFLSRRRFHINHGYSVASARSTAQWDNHLEAEFATAGFTVVHPETLPIEEQVAFVRGADVIAGSAGSALHLAAFARSGSAIIEIGDARSSTTPLPTQTTINAARSHRSAFVGYQDQRRLRAVLHTLNSS